MHTGHVCTVVPGREPAVVTDIEAGAAGLGWTPDGELLVVSMHDRRLVRVTARGTATVADLSAHTPHPLNDMVVDSEGRAYIGTFGFDGFGGGERAPGDVLLVHPDGRHEVAATNLMFPNGMVITRDGNTLVVAETFSAQLTAFTRRGDGTLTDRRVWAELPHDVMPDGICADATGAIWVASVTTHECLLVHEGGVISERVSTGDQMAIACALSGPETPLLHVATNRHLSPRRTREHHGGRISAVEVDVGAPS